MSKFITIRGLGRIDDLQAWLGQGLVDSVKHPSVMQPLIKQGFVDSISSGAGFGTKVREVEWRGTSSSGRPWQPLSESTRQKRIRRGYTPDDILVQSGQLKAAGLTPFIKWGKTTKRSSRSFTAPYNKSTGAISMNASNFNGRFHASISGKRVENQYGGKILFARKRWGTRDRLRRSALPRREFWYLDERSIRGSIPHMLDALSIQWRLTAPRGLRFT